jgi:hypothetical protein
MSDCLRLGPVLILRTRVGGAKFLTLCALKVSAHLRTIFQTLFLRKLMKFFFIRVGWKDELPLDTQTSLCQPARA